AATSASGIASVASNTLNFTYSLTGGAGEDDIIGTAGADTIVGNGACDRLRGNAGADVFVFAAGDDQGACTRFGYSSDAIMDFAVGTDFIDLSPFTETLSPIGQSSFSSMGRPEVRWVNSGSDTVVTIDRVGNGTTGFSLRLIGVDATTLTSGSFLFR